MESEQQSKLTLTVSEVAALLRLSKGVCYEAIRTGQIPSLRFGRVIRIPRYGLQCLLSKGKEDINDEGLPLINVASDVEDSSRRS